MKIFIRADGGESVGLGHVMRTLVLANELRKINNEVIYLCKNDKRYEVGIEKIKLDGFQVILLKSEEIIGEIISTQKRINADLLITDSYDVNEEYFDRLRSHFKITGYIDDVNKCRMNVDFLINQNINSKDLNYSKTTGENTKLFLGPEYCMLRDEFRNFYEENIYTEEISNILLTLGGMDDEFNTLNILGKIRKSNKNIHVVIGNAFKEELVYKLKDISKSNKNVILYENPKMSLVMSKCQIALSACGSTLYELCAMNIPTIGIILASNQKEVGETMKYNGLLLDIVYEGTIDKYDFNINIERFSKDKRKLLSIIENQKKLVNIYGAKKLVNSIGNMI